MTNRRLLICGILVLLTRATYAFTDEQKQTAIDPHGVRQAPRESVNISLPRQPGEMTQPMLQPRNPRYRLRYGDVLELKFPFTPEFDQKSVTVQPDGFISLRDLGDLHVEGKTKDELVQVLREAYAKILHDPIITVNLLEFEKPYFIVGGQVQKPGKYDMRGDTSVVQAVNIAGGFNGAAKHSQVLLFRRVSDEWVQVTRLDLKKMFDKADLTEDPHLRPGDMVYVPKSFVSKIRGFIPGPDAWLWWGMGRRY